MDSAILFSGYAYAFGAGFFGATFWMIIELQLSLTRSSETDLREMWTFRMITLRCLFGVGAATILYFILQSALLISSVWPDMSLVGFSENKRVVSDGFFGGSTVALPNKDMSLLLVWCFLAGYSQKLVPNLLSKTTESDLS